MTLFVARLADGMTNGFVYALLALALVIVFRGTGAINFAQGEIALFTTYLAWWMGTEGVNAWLSLLAAMAAGLLIGPVAERLLVRPAQRRGPMAALLILLALFSAFNSLDAVLWDPNPHLVPGLFPHKLTDYLTVGGARIYWTSLGVWIAALVILAATFAVVGRTRLGLTMRAATDNPESAALSGINVGRTYGASWALACVVGSVAGVLIAPVSPQQLSPATMLPVLVFASAAAVLGGLDSLVGAVVGGLILGVASSLITGYVGFVGPTLPQTSALVVMVAVLLLRPNGLFGSRSQVRV
jgi:branched-chain amino acid transport system permease protein